VPATKRTRIYTLFALIIAFLGGILWYVRQGPNTLELYRAQLLAQGEILTLDALAPKRTGLEPDGEIPLRTAISRLNKPPYPSKAGLFGLQFSSNGVPSIQFLDHPKATNSAQRAAIWQLAETDFAQRRADLTLLSTALHNPPREKGADYRQVASYPRPNVVQRRTVAQFLQNAVISDIHAGLAAESATNLNTLLNLAALHREEWSLVNQMVRVAVTRLTLDDLAYGLAAHTWDEPALARFQTNLAALSLVTNVYQSLLYERAIGTWAYAERRTNSANLTNSLHVPQLSPSPNFATKILTGYWVKMNIDTDEESFLRFSQQRFELLRAHLQSATWAGVPAELEAQQDAFFSGTETLFGQPKNWMAQILASNLSRALATLIATENLRLQAITVIALERYRLAHGRYPDTLAELTPIYLPPIPQDPMDGHPLRYRLNPDGTFTLWSVGFDGKDDGGDPTMPNPQKQTFPQDAKDLVWPKLDPVDLPTKP